MKKLNDKGQRTNDIQAREFSQLKYDRYNKQKTNQFESNYHLDGLNAVIFV